ncbi:MAG: NAD(P)-dependent oxidoreductase [Chloroflexi bacterium]|nr:NAD(P)-dependent oxidoreductase [Chloroflexota bacterium]
MTQPSRILVTGAGGFIGSHVVTALERRGAEAIPFEGDYHDEDAVEAATRSHSPVALVHSAWRLAPGSSYLDDPAHIEELRASLRLFTLSHRAGCVRLVGIGTCLEYDASAGPTPEDAPLRPRNLYGAAKAALFMSAQAWAQSTDVSFGWARLYYPFGPGEASQRLIPTVINALIRGERVATTAGLQRRSFLYVEDAADAIAAITLSDATGAFNVGSAEASSVRDIVERLAQLMGRPELVDIGTLGPRPGDPDVLWPDTRRLNDVLDWQPRKSLDQGLADTVAWWRGTTTSS